ncbi:MAG: PAS domain S-box protein [Deltaproteobacteria bacterium]|nr:PAS domain S-box protein [Deltaproteobacteria bacterium]MCB9788576.1 PAS domain S-box protein [Deltaproteobacteria bacterium]
MDLFTSLFDTSDFPARWHCGKWSDALGYTHIVSDLLVWSAYVAIPMLLAWFFYRRRKQTPFPKIGWLFVAFIFFCGTTHLLEAIIFWHPVYRFAGLMKAITAGVSWLTVFAMIPAVPRALARPSPAELTRAEQARARAEADSRRTERHFKSAFFDAPTGMALLGRDGVCVTVNAALCVSLGATEDELVGRRLRDMFLPEDRAAQGDGIEGVCQGEIERYRGTKRILDAEGETLWLDVSASAVRDDEPGEFIVVHLVDVTEQIAAEASLRHLNEALEARIAERTAELQRSNEELERFGYAAAHDLKAPLRAIANLNQWIAEEQAAGNEERAQEYRALLHGRVMRMKRLVDDLLGYARAAHVEELVGTTNLAEAVEAAIEQVRPPPEVSVEVEASLPSVEAARGPLQQIFANLIGNALKHGAPTVRHIRISVDDAGEFWQLAVADDGPGIPAEHRERVFEMFHTLRPRDEVEGSGLGLSLVRRTVMSRGGSVSLAETEGGGCTVRVLWPKVARAVTSPGTKRSPSSPEEAT